MSKYPLSNGTPITQDNFNDAPTTLELMMQAVSAGIESTTNYGQNARLLTTYINAANFFEDVGVANQYQLVANSNRYEVHENIEGLTIHFRPLNANTGAATISVSGQTAVNLLTEDGNALTGGELTTNKDSIVRYDGTAFRLIGSQIQKQVTEIASKIDGNVFVNGGFNFWQEGTSFTGITTRKFFADVWLAQPSTLGNFNISRQSLTLNEQLQVDGGIYYTRITQTNASAVNTRISHKISTIGTPSHAISALSGKKVTLSFYARTIGTAPGNLTFDFVQNFGTGGSAETLTSNQIILGTSLTGNFKRFTKTITIPSISGKTLGTNPYCFFRMINTATGAYEYDVTNIKLELGEIATPFIHRPFTEELALCQEWFEKSYNLDVNPGTAGTESGTTTFRFGPNTTILGGIKTTTFFKVPKQKNLPSITLFDLAGTSGRVRIFNGTTDPNGYIATVESLSRNGFHTANPDTTSMNGMQYHWISDARDLFDI